MIFNNDKALTTAKHYQVRFWIYHFLVFFNQYTVYSCKYVIELMQGWLRLPSISPFLGLAQTVSTCPTQQGISSGVPLHVTSHKAQVNPEHSGISASCSTVGHSIPGAVEPHFSQGGTSLETESQQRSDAGTVYCKGQLFSWSPHCWSAKTNKDFLGLLLCNSSAHSIVSCPRPRRSMKGLFSWRQ